MKKSDKIILWIIGIISFFGACTLNAQKKQISFMAGYKALEVSGAYESENEFIYGLSFVAVDSEMTEKRANTNDKGTNHEFKTDYNPAAFFLIGAKFEKLSIIGKIGCAYIDQNINGNPEPQNIYVAFGIIFDYKVSNFTGVRVSYDAVSGPMAGVSLNF